MRDAKFAGNRSGADSIVHGRASCPQVLIGQHAKPGAGVDAGFDESLSNGLNVEPVFLFAICT